MMSTWTLITSAGNGSNPLTNGHPKADIYGGTFRFLGTLSGNKVYSVCSFHQPEPDNTGAQWQFGLPSVVAAGYTSNSNTFVTCQVLFENGFHYYPIDLPDCPKAKLHSSQPLTIAQRNALVSPDAGDLVYISDGSIKQYQYYNGTAWTAITTGGGGGGAVDSVNSQTGDVVLDADDISDTSTTKKFVTAAEKTKLSNLSGTNTGDQNLTPYFNKSVDDTDDITIGTTNKFVTSAEKTKLSNLSGTNSGDQDLSSYATKTGVETLTNKTLTAPVISTTANITDSTNKRFVTDANLTTIGNQSGVNTGDQDLSSYQTLGNKSSDVNTDQASTVKYPTVKAIYDWAISLFVQKNASITGATKTKITYDAKGLVTSGADATTADIADSSNKRYVTDANLVTIGNQSGTNTGDQNLSGYATLSGTETLLNKTVDGSLNTVTNTEAKAIRVKSNSTLPGTCVKGELYELADGTLWIATSTNTWTQINTALDLLTSKYLDQSGSKIYAVASGTDTYTLTLTPAITSYTAGEAFAVKFTNANTTASTININSLGAIALKKNGTTALDPSDLSAGSVKWIVYDGTNFQVLGIAIPNSDATLTTTDITTNNASTTKHGFLKKLSNVSTEFMDGTGAWSTPASLPAQTGNAGKFVTTNGTTASWSSLGLSKYLYNADVGLRAWYFALGNSVNQTANIVVVGDSIGAGYYATNNYGFVQIIKDVLQKRYGRGNEESLFYEKPDGTTETRFVSTVGSWGNLSYGGVHGEAFAETGATKRLTVSNLYGDGLEFYYVRNQFTNATFNYTIDGGADIPVNQTVTAAGAETVVRVAVTGLSVGNHTLVIKGPATNYVFITAANGTLGTTGVRVYNYCVSGAGTSGNYSTTDNRHYATNAMVPSLTIIQYNSNDYAAQIALSTFSTRIQGMITAAQAVNSSVLLVASIPRAGVTESSGLTQQMYVDTMYSLAITNGCAFLNLYEMFVSTSLQTTLGLSGDNIHPNDKGHRGIANAILNAISGSSNFDDGITATIAAAGTDTYTASVNPYLPFYVQNQPYYVKFTNANTGASTLNINGLGAKSIKKNGNVALASGDIAAGQVKILVYDGTNFQIGI